MTKRFGSLSGRVFFNKIKKKLKRSDTESAKNVRKRDRIGMESRFQIPNFAIAIPNFGIAFFTKTSKNRHPKSQNAI